MAEKTEKATPKKLKDARKKGQVAKPQDLSQAMTFFVSIMGTIAMMGMLFENLGSFMLQMFRAAGQSDSDFETKAGGYFTTAFQTIVSSSAPLMIVVLTVGVVTSFLVVGPVFSFESMKFDLKKLNPIEGIKQKFKVKVLVDLLKSIAKITGAAIIIYIVVIWNGCRKSSRQRRHASCGSALIVNDFLFTAAHPGGHFFLADRHFRPRLPKENVRQRDEDGKVRGEAGIQGHGGRSA